MRRLSGRLHPRLMTTSRARRRQSRRRGGSPRRPARQSGDQGRPLATATWTAKKLIVATRGRRAADADRIDFDVPQTHARPRCVAAHAKLPSQRRKRRGSGMSGRSSSIGGPVPSRRRHHRCQSSTVGDRFQRGKNDMGRARTRTLTDEIDGDVLTANVGPQYNRLAATRARTGVEPRRYSPAHGHGERCRGRRRDLCNAREVPLPLLAAGHCDQRIA